MIAAQGVVVRRGGRVLLDGVDFAAAAGSFTAIVGPNGAGKSTLLKVLSGDLAADAGTVTVLGRALREWPRRDLARRRAVLPQGSLLAFAFRARDVVRLGRLPFGARPDDRRRAEAALAEVGLADRAAELYPNLSGGEQRRVQYARVLAQIADAAEAGEGVLLLDEPTANLDPAHGLSVLAHARRLADRGLTVVAVVHDINLATPFSDRFVGLREGRVRFAGAAAETVTAANLGELFGIEAVVTPHPVHACPTVAFVAPM
ncbi:Hemin import ATP-binding protein HmuV [uncultured Alphaproteobacteria bacterium]|uniref:Hemin import ATP-binding protein HmuV n=1 Tax=uncultured Alphaproteobacteria bacterium TaxID=91750 RepID=A0A212J1B9_9PROT|nr:Hemin import ATP-binding protein HmuV [uncultured Alphaproteobacteria bacterium]